MKTKNCVILLAALLLSMVLGEPDEERYADVSCQYQWGGTVCNCENLKYVMTVDPYGDRIFFIYSEVLNYF